MKYIIDDLCIDKTSYSIKDQIKGYVAFAINPILQKYDQEKIQNLELSIEFGGQYDTCSPDYEYGNNTFIFQKELLKKFKNIQENSIYEAFSFQQDIDLITTSGYQQNKYPSIKYYIKAVCQKERNFVIYRPFPSIVRKIEEQINLPVQSVFCCTYGQIQVKIGIDKTDFQINDIANIQIEIDTRLMSISMPQVDICLISEDYQEVTNFIYSQTYQRITCNFQQNKLYQIQQQLPIKCQEKQYKEFYASTECQAFAHKYFIQFRILFGCLVQPIIIQLPIILYQTQKEHLKLFMKRDIINNEEFNSDHFQQNIEFNKFIQMDIKQKQWNDRLINFQKTDYQQHSGLQNKTIKVQSQIK